MAKVLITGSNGFLGSHLAKVLCDRGDDVTCLVRKSSNLSRLNGLPVTFAYGDVTDVESLRDPITDKDVVYHLGAIVRTLRTKDFYEVNEKGTENVAKLCAEQSSPPVLVVTSSLAAAMPTRDGTPIREGMPCAPTSHYGRSKLKGEDAARRYSDRVPTTIVRAAAVFGESDPSCFDMFQPIHRFGIHLYPKRLGVSMIHRDDLVEFLRLAAERGRRIEPATENGEINDQGLYFAACDEYPMYDQLGRMMGEALGRKRVLTIPIRRPGVWITSSVYEMIGQLIRRPLNLNIDKCREATAGCWFCSTTKANEEIGFKPGANLNDRLRQTAQWYLKQGWL